MTLPISGAIQFSDINTELGRNATAQLGIDDSAVRTLFGIATGAIDINTGHGKSNRVVSYFVFSSNSFNATADLIAGTPGYIAGKTDFVITVNPGVYLYAPDDTGAGLLINGLGLAAGDTVRLINQGYIMGLGGDGGGGGAYSLQRPGFWGGDGTHAIDLYCNITIDNTYAGAYIGGGGGGGGGGGCSSSGGKIGFNGGGGGGGAGGGVGGFHGSGNQMGGAGGDPGQQGAQGIGGEISPGNGAVADGGGSGGGGGNIFGSGAGGGRQFPGTGGTNVVSGGSANNSGTTPPDSTGAGGGGGGWGAAGGNGGTGGGAIPGAGGAGGQAVRLNGYTVTWVSGNTSRVYGAVS